MSSPQRLCLYLGRCISNPQAINKLVQIVVKRKITATHADGRETKMKTLSKTKYLEGLKMMNKEKRKSQEASTKAKRI